MLNTIHIGTIANAAERKSLARLSSGSTQRRADQTEHHQPAAAPAIAQPPVNRMHRGGSNRGDAEQRADGGRTKAEPRS